MNWLLLSYILVPLAFVVMMKNYQKTNWLWLGFMAAGIFIGVAGFVAFTYLVTVYVLDNGKAKKKDWTVKYQSNGEYTVYKSEDTKAAPSPGKMAFRIVGGLIAGVAICFGLFIVGIMLFVSVSCGGNSKCM